MVNVIERSRRALQSATAFMGGTAGSLAQRTMRSGVWVGLSSAGQNLLQTLRSIALARLLSPEIFGLMGICMVVIRGLELFTETGTGPALIQRRDRVEEATSTAFALQMIRGFVLGGLACAIAPFAARYYDEPQLQSLVCVLAIAFLLNGFVNIHIVLLQKGLDFRRLTRLDLLVACASTAAILTLAAWLRSVWALVLGQIVTSAIRLALSYRMVPGRPRITFDRGIARELLGYGRYITGLTVVLFVTTEAGNLIIAKLIGFRELGLYAMAYTLANLPSTHVAKTVSTVIFPAYSTLQGRPDRIRVAYLAVLRLVGGIAIPAAVGLAVLAPEIVRVVYGEKWVAMVPALQILAFFGAARAIGVVGGSLYNAIGKPKISFYLSAVKLVAILAVIVPLIRAYGIAGAAVAVTVPQVLGDAFGLLMIQKQIDLRVRTIVPVLVRIGVACAVMTGVLVLARWLLRPVGVLDLMFLVGTGAGAYLLLSLKDARSLYVEHLRSGRTRGDLARATA